MTTGKKILLSVGILGIAIGGYALTKYLTRNIVKNRGWTIKFKEYDTPASGEPLED